MRTSRTSSTPKTGRLLAALLCLLLAVGASLCFGAVPLDLPAALKELWAGVDTARVRIFLYSRLPRTAAPLLAGAAFAVSGALIQGMMNNALASPNIIGVNSGAGLGCVLAAAFCPALPKLVPLASFLGAFGAAALVCFLGSRMGASRLTLVLTGMAVGTTLTAVTNAVKTFYPTVLTGTASFFLGGFSGVILDDLFPAAVLILLGIALACVFARGLDVLELGEETALSLGLPAASLRLFLLLDASLLAGAAVSFSGLLGFVGLAVPHIARRLFGTEHRVLLPACALLGAAFLTGCDTLSRMLFAPFDLPVGVVTSLIGGPFFLFLLTKKQRGRLYGRM